MSDQMSDELYSISDAEVQREYVRVRRAKKWVPFFLPHLKPGMKVLDCGCGVGSITVDLAETVEPGHVVGIDLDPGQLEDARSLAKERGLDNITFEVGNIYELEYPDASFDAVLAHTVLVHLSDPLRALREMRRVLKPGGVAGVSDDDYDTIVFSPSDPIFEKAIALWIKYMVHNGASITYSRHLRSYLRQAGFSRTEGHASRPTTMGRNRKHDDLPG